MTERSSMKVDGGALVSVALAIGGLLMLLAPALWPTPSLGLAFLAIVVAIPTVVRGGSRRSRLVALAGVGLGIAIMAIVALSVAFDSET